MISFFASFGFYMRWIFMNSGFKRSKTSSVGD